MGKKSKQKAPKGRAGAKKKAKRGGGGGPGANGAQDFVRSSTLARQMLDDDDDDDSFKLFTGFAQNTPRNFTPRTLNANVKLRHQAIAFVSAGTNTPAEESDQQDEHSEEEEPEEDVDDSAIQTNILVDTDVEISEGAIAQMNIQSSAETTGPDTDNTSSDFDMHGVDKAVQNTKSAFTEEPLFVVDTVGDPSLATASKADGKRPVRREPSPARSDSSEEIVLFHGRNKPPPTSSAKQSQPKNPSPQQQSEKLSTPQPQAPQTSGPAPKAPPQAFHQPQAQQDNATPSFSSAATSTSRVAIGWAAKPSKLEEEVNPDAIWAPAPAIPYWRKRKPRPDLDASPAEKAAFAALPPKASKVMFADPQTDGNDAEQTIEDLRAEVRAVRRAKQNMRDQDLTETKLPQSKRRSKRGRKKDNRQLRNPIISDDDGSAGEAASDDYLSNLAAQLDGNVSSADQGFTSSAFHSSAMGGPSLVVDGEEIDDHEVLRSHVDMMNDDDSSSTSSGPVVQDLSSQSSDDDGDYEDSSELENDLEYTERQQWEDEEDLRRRRQARKTDEQLAYLFAKQEELGIYDDDLVLDNGDCASQSQIEGLSDIEGIGDVEEARAGLGSMAYFSQGRMANKHGIRRSGNRNNGNFNFPDASAFADTVEQYGENGFDIMDFDRPSLRPIKKGRKGQMPPELAGISDDELKENMRDTWENDRTKKAQKKAERELLRAEGLLRSAGGNGKADLKQKYQFGMTITQVHVELRTFMEDDDMRERAFPPMGKTDRKALHEIANALNLKSKSMGSGKTRFPILYKTARTFYDSKSFDKAIIASQRGWLSGGKKLGKKFAKDNAKMGRAGTGRGSNNAAVSLQHGDIVGAGAAEIGNENFGFKLMAKMGWSKGMALGKEGEGRLQPVEQMMRAGRAGLG